MQSRTEKQQSKSETLSVAKPTTPEPPKPKSKQIEENIRKIEEIEENTRKIKEKTLTFRNLGSVEVSATVKSTPTSDNLNSESHNH